MKQLYPKCMLPSTRTTPLTMNMMMQLGMQFNVTAAVRVQLCAKHGQWIFIYRDGQSAHYVWTSTW